MKAIKFKSKPKLGAKFNIGNEKVKSVINFKGIFIRPSFKSCLINCNKKNTNIFPKELLFIYSKILSNSFKLVFRAPGTTLKLIITYKEKRLFSNKKINRNLENEINLNNLITLEEVQYITEELTKKEIKAIVDYNKLQLQKKIKLWDIVNSLKQGKQGSLSGILAGLQSSS